MSADSPTLLTIDLGAIAANYRLLAERARPAVAAASIKADAYGLGVAPVSRTLWAEGCRDFFVATLDEGIELRGLLPESRITVLNGLIAGEPALFREHALMPALNDLGQVDEWRGIARYSGPAPAVLHLDTGMSRLGLPPVELDILARDHSRLDGFELALDHEPSGLRRPTGRNHEPPPARRLRRCAGPPAPHAGQPGGFVGHIPGPRLPVRHGPPRVYACMA